MQEFLEIGQIVNTFGIKGMVKIKPFTDDIKKFEKLKKIYLEKNASKNEYEIEEVKFKNEMVLLKLKGINSIDEAEPLRNSFIKIKKIDEEKLDEGTYYIADLLGFDVITDKNINLGKLKDVINYGSADIYVVKSSEGKEILLPAISDVVKSINLEEKKIIVHILKGLI